MNWVLDFFEYLLQTANDTNGYKFIKLTLARRQIQCTSVQATIRSYWYIWNPINAEAIISILWADILQKIIFCLEMECRNAAKRAFPFVMNLHRTTNLLKTRDLFHQSNRLDQWLYLQIIKFSKANFWGWKRLIFNIFSIDLNNGV